MLKFLDLFFKILEFFSLIGLTSSGEYIDIPRERTALLKRANVWIAKGKVAGIALDKSSKGLDR